MIRVTMAASLMGMAVLCWVAVGAHDVVAKIKRWR